MIDLADRLLAHTKSDEATAFGSLLGVTYPLTDLLAGWIRIGGSREVAPGVVVTMPAGCRWQTSDRSDGRVKFAFTYGPVVNVRKTVGPLAGRADLEVTDIVVGLGAAALEMEFSLRRFPDFTLTIPLRWGA